MLRRATLPSRQQLLLRCPSSMLDCGRLRVSHALQHVAHVHQQSVVDALHLHRGRLPQFASLRLSTRRPVHLAVIGFSSEVPEHLEAVAIKEHAAIGAVELNSIAVLVHGIAVALAVFVGGDERVIALDSQVISSVSGVSVLSVMNFLKPMAVMPFGP